MAQKNSVDEDWLEGEDETCVEAEGVEADFEKAEEYLRLRKRERVVREVRAAREERRGLAPKSRKGLRWDFADDQLLRSLWGEFSLGSIASRLKRTLSAVSSRAHAKVGLPSPRQGRMSLREAERLTGYSRSTIQKAAARLKIEIGRVPSGSVNYTKCVSNRSRWYGLCTSVDEEDLDRITAYLKKAAPVHLRKKVWGVHGELDACAQCGRTKHPPRHFGRCAQCVSSAVRRARLGIGDEQDVAILRQVMESKRGHFVRPKKEIRCRECDVEFLVSVDRAHLVSGVCRKCRDSARKRQKIVPIG